jgi:hypothetical protein
VEIGLFIRYGKLIPGREVLGLELFEEARQYFSDKLIRGEITYYEPFFLKTSDYEEETGFMILKGPAPEIFRLMEEEPYRHLVTKATMLVEHFQVDMLTVGEEVPLQIERASKVRVELGV